MTQEKSCGIVFFAYNTSEINYMRFAAVSAMFAKRHLDNVSISIVTRKGDLNWFLQHDKNNLADIFDNIILSEYKGDENYRKFYDSPYTIFESNFQNRNKHKVINYTPYDNTLLLDVDYIIQNDDFKQFLESESDIRLFNHAEHITGEEMHDDEQWFHEHGIKLVWSTVICFNKHSELTNLFFNLWGHVSDNYEYYKFLYGFPGNLHRTDFCASIAAHILNGMQSEGSIDNFGQNMICMSQRDDIAKINALDDWTFLANNRKEEWKNTLARITRENVHVMNKRALDRHVDSIIQMFKKKENHII